MSEARPGRMRLPALESPSDLVPADEELARRVRGGDEEAWSQLLERHTELLRRQAARLAREAAGLTREGREDEAADLYLFLAELVRRSISSFRGRCRLKTWILAVIGNRSHVLKAYLRRKDPARADVRIPAVLRDRSETDKAIFRRLVWGLEPRRIALELDVPESLCWDVEDVLARRSRRVYERIRANRLARAWTLRLGPGAPEDPGEIDVADPSGDPHQQMVRKGLERSIGEELDGVLAQLAAPERRLLYLIYNEGLSTARVAERARAGESGLAGLDDVNHCYYLKDRVLQAVSDRIVARLSAAGHEPATTGRRRVLRCIEDLLRERGVPMSPPRSPDPGSMSL